MSHDLPAWLKAAVESLLDGQAGKAIFEASSRVTAAYRDGKPSAVAIASEIDARAYVAARMPATFAAISAALSETLKRCPGYQPSSLLDIGAGPGTASFAASEWLPGLTRVTMLDHNAAFLKLSQQLGAESPAVAIRGATVERADIATLDAGRSASLVVAAYAMVELRSEALAGFVQSLWRACEDVLLIVEPGTPIGFRNLLHARRVLVAAGASIVAPCPSNFDCPLIAPDWCHFSQRLSRSRLHIQAKGASVPFEDEKFSYLAVSRHKLGQTAQRILSPPQENKAGVTLRLCTETGVVARTVQSRDKARFKQARKLKWGDCFEI